MRVDAFETLRFAVSDKGGRLEVFQDGTKKITEIAIYCEYYLCNFLIDFIPQD